MKSKAQLAASERVTQILTAFRKSLRARWRGWPDPYDYSVAELEGRLLGCVKEITALVTDHSLGEELIAASKQKLLSQLYDEAGRREEHAWQAAFAKRHALP